MRENEQICSPKFDWTMILNKTSGEFRDQNIEWTDSRQISFVVPVDVVCGPTAFMTPVGQNIQAEWWSRKMDPK